MLILLIHGLHVDEKASYLGAAKWQDVEVCPESCGYSGSLGHFLCDIFKEKVDGCWNFM